MTIIKLFCIYNILHSSLAFSSRPNIVVILTDDQDLEMNSLSYMPKLQSLLIDQGALFNNFYAHIPVCCPSRSSLYSGQYQHNMFVTGNAIESNCSSISWQQTSEKKAFVTYLEQSGYLTSFAGKYLNDYGAPAVGGVAHVPNGWTNWQGLVGNSIYYNYVMSNNGIAEKHSNVYPQDYLPLVILNKTLSFIDDNANKGNPLFTYVSLPSCHGPHEAEPKYQSLFPDIKAPRTPAYNATVPNAHWLQAVKAVYPYDDNSAAFSDLVFRRRIQTLQTVDDIIETLVDKFTSLNQIDNTYFLYSADNGYHTGHFGFIYDKRQPWETDTHLPFIIRGPSIAKKSQVDALVSMPDLAATILDIASITPPSQFDGTSLLPYLKVSQDEENENEVVAPNPRLMVLFEYVGEGGSDSGPCAPTLGQPIFCGRDGNYSLPPYFYGNPLCVCQDSTNSTYTCLRYKSDIENYRYCKFIDDVNRREYFDYISDPYELTNIVDTIPQTKKDALDERITALRSCSGSTNCDALLTSTI
jgi:N-acetylglucosamine-6-sulfatase